MKQLHSVLVLIAAFLFPSAIHAQDKTSELFPHHPDQFTHADTLRGSNTPWRSWWDVTFYDLQVRINLAERTISGCNAITYRVNSAAPETPQGQLQIDLMQPLLIDSITQNGLQLPYTRQGNAFFVQLHSPQKLHSLQNLKVYYHGHPKTAKNAPWDGGFIWSEDAAGRPWVATACQGVGASIWWPNKDYQGDEPDSQRIAITVAENLMDVSNGRLRQHTQNDDHTTTYEWFVDNPINNYDVAVNVGQFAHFADTLSGEKGTLTLDYYALPENLQKAQKQFRQAKPMLHCFEHWFGPYPWYKDGYKLVEAPFLGMEHQSCVAYGNGFENGYRGRDLSHTGQGMKWDFIIIHESAHEWWGNNITTKDLADMWVHEAFANYAEALYTEWLFGREAGDAYCRGTRKNVLNDKPIIPAYGVNEEGSGDMYYKGGNMILCIREWINDDQKFRDILRGLNQTFHHQTVTGQQVKDYINREAGIDFSKVFQQYLTTTQIPQFEYYIRKKRLHYRWNKVVPGFNMPIKVQLNRDSLSFIYPTEQWQVALLQLDSKKDFAIDPNFYVRAVKKR